MWTDNDKFLQDNYGDVLVGTDGDRMVAVEIKTERENKHGNLFLETWSNKKWQIHGWMDKLGSCDILIYTFLDSDDFYVLHFPTLARWFKENKKMYREKPQNIYVQANDTWGRPVPIRVLERENLLTIFRFSEKDTWKEKWETLLEKVKEEDQSKTIVNNFDRARLLSCIETTDIECQNEK